MKTRIMGDAEKMKTRITGDAENIEYIHYLRKNLENNNFFAEITLRKNLKSLMLLSINQLWKIDFKRKIVFYLIKWFL